MPTVHLTSKQVAVHLDDLKKKIDKAIDWLHLHTDPITLEIPEPFDHALRRGPKKPKGAGCVGFDRCGEMGILLAILQTIESHEPAGSKGRR